MRRKCEKSGRKRKLIKVKRLKKNRDQNIILKCDKDYCVYHKQTEGYTWNACVFLKFYIYYYHYLKQSTLYNMRVKMKILGRFLLDGEGESGSGDNPRL